MDAVGAAAPTDFQKTDFAPTDFEDILFFTHNFCTRVPFTFIFLGVCMKICPHASDILTRVLLRLFYNGSF